MSKIKEFKNKLQAYWQRTQPARSTAGRILRGIGLWIYRLRGPLMTIPVALAALWLAMRNSQILPENVGINLLASGQYQWMVDRSTAIWVPLAVTGVCLLFMICSRKTLYPWLISIFSLILPVMIYITNVFPA